MITWAEQYKVDGFRFDLMGFHPKANILAVRAGLDRLTLVDGTSILLYGEGWNFGDVADDARFTQATQRNMAGTGIGTFNDQLRDAVRGGNVLDADPRIQGFGSGLFSAPNGAEVNGSWEAQRARLLRYQELIKIGLAGNLENYRFTGSPGTETAARGAGYNAEPGEAITYVDCHDNETLFDTLSHKLPARHLDGRPGTHAVAVAGHRAARPGNRLRARWQRTAAIEVPRPQLLQFRRLVQPAAVGLQGRQRLRCRIAVGPRESGLLDL